MASTTTGTQASLSIPKSRPTAMRHKSSPKSIHEHDSFFNSPEETLTATSERSATESDDRPKDEPEPLWTRVILTPLLTVSFSSSSFFVERRQRAWRSSQHGSRGESIWSKLSPSAWLDPEPYQDHRNTTWQGQGHVNSNDTLHRSVPTAGMKNEKWFHRKKHRKIASLELGYAFEMSGQMMLLIVSWSGVFSVGMAWLGMKAFA